MDEMKCDVIGCSEDAEYEDEMGNLYCEDCMNMAIDEEERDPEEFELF